MTRSFLVMALVAAAAIAGAWLISTHPPSGLVHIERITPTTSTSAPPSG